MIRVVQASWPVLLLSFVAFPQSRTITHHGHRIELQLERLDAGGWHTVDPGLVLAQGDRVRFRFHTNFDGYLYVTNQSTSGKYEQLFPRAETGQDNRIQKDTEYRVPATDTVFRIAGPAGYETVYWLVSPTRIGGPPAAPPVKPLPHLIPRCDDAILHARGDCIDSAAGPHLVPRGEDLPGAEAPSGSARDLLFLRQKDTAVISSPTPLTGPVIYEFRLAHR